MRQMRLINVYYCTTTLVIDELNVWLYSMWPLSYILAHHVDWLKCSHLVAVIA